MLNAFTFYYFFSYNLDNSERRATESFKRCKFTATIAGLWVKSGHTRSARNRWDPKE